MRPSQPHKLAQSVSLCVGVGCGVCEVLYVGTSCGTCYLVVDGAGAADPYTALVNKVWLVERCGEGGGSQLGGEKGEI